MMFSWRLCVISSLICYFVTAAAEPSCDGVADFGACIGDTRGFCPSGIECSCKAELAFCSCPYYKGPHTEYWYMGSKCDQLWSTWDLLVIAVFPGVALAFVVIVIAQLIYYCKITAKIKTKKSKTINRIPESHPNQTFVSEEELGRRSRYVDVALSNIPPLSHQETAAWNVAAPQSPLNRSNSSYYPDVPPVSHNAVYAEIKRKQSQKFGKPSYEYPDQDYNVQPRSPQHIPRPGVPSFPQADYRQGDLGLGNRPFSFRRPQVNYDYD
ncbi:uncharacterized protein [Pyxicephalus adspersus]|uniref:uncharacterized protein n=1 Tax=Pyxicephalus adspersus TaxID=30357 RepID=UPI003B5CFCF0